MPSESNKVHCICDPIASNLMIPILIAKQYIAKLKDIAPIIDSFTISDKFKGFGAQLNKA